MIKQRSWGDCGVATLLNAVCSKGNEYFSWPGGYERMVELLNGRSTGLTIQEICAAVFELGYVPMYVPLEGFVLASGIANAYTHDSAVMLNYTICLKEMPAIFQVKTKSGLLHFVYFDGFQIWDPAHNVIEEKKFSDYEDIIDVVYLLPMDKPFDERGLSK